jgi:hypothetical protein
VHWSKVDLPEVEVVRPQPPERFLQLPHAGLAVPSVGADLGHQEDLVAPALQRLPHPFLAAAAVVLPGVVEESHARVHRFVDEPDRLRRGADRTEVIPAEPQDGYALAGAPERLARNIFGAGVRHVERTARSGGCRVHERAHRYDRPRSLQACLEESAPIRGRDFRASPWLSFVVCHDTASAAPRGRCPCPTCP